MNNKFSRFLSLFLLISLLAGCGFQLRGMGGSGTVLPEDWKSMNLATNNPNSEFSREVISRFEANGVVWTERQSAKFRLVLGGEVFNQRNLTLNSAARAAEYELTMSSTFAVFHADGSIALEETKGSIVKQMENDPRNVVGKSEEVRLLKQEMRSELGQQIVRRIGFFASSLQQSEADPNNVTTDVN
jgi:LPS-assembly lipoprotein